VKNEIELVKRIILKFELCCLKVSDKSNDDSTWI